MVDSELKDARAVIFAAPIWPIGTPHERYLREQVKHGPKPGEQIEDARSRVPRDR